MSEGRYMTCIDRINDSVEYLTRAIRSRLVNYLKHNINVNRIKLRKSSALCYGYSRSRLLYDCPSRAIADNRKESVQNQKVNSFRFSPIAAVHLPNCVTISSDCQLLLVLVNIH